MGPLPAPPADLVMPSGWEMLFTVVCAALAAGLAVYAVWLWRRDGDVVPMLILAGGALCTFWEPLIDIGGLCWYPREGQMHLFETFGRPMPVLVLFGYTWFMGGMTLVAYRWVQTRGVHSLPLLYALTLLVTPPFEWFAVQTGVYRYYGEQPLVLFDWPMWWVFVNSAVPIVAAVVITAARPYLTGLRILAVVALVPMVDGAVNAATALPVWTALNGGITLPIGQLFGLATCGLAVFVVYLVTRVDVGPVRSRPAVDAAGISIAKGA